MVHLERNLGAVAPKPLAQNFLNVFKTSGDVYVYYITNVADQSRRICRCERKRPGR